MLLSIPSPVTVVNLAIPAQGGKGNLTPFYETPASFFAANIDSISFLDITHLQE